MDSPLCAWCGEPGTRGDPLKAIPLYDSVNTEKVCDVWFAHRRCGPKLHMKLYDVTEEHLEIWRRIHPAPKRGADIANPSY